MNFVRALLSRTQKVMSPMPPPPGRDPEMVDHAIRTARVLSKADRAIERRHRLNLELAHAEDVIRSARGAGRPR